MPLAIVAGAILLQPARAWANGRYPAADELVFDQKDPKHMVVRATYGFIETFDGGQNWLWVCEQAVGRIGDKDPPIAVMADGTVVVAVPFQGLLMSRDKGCTWTGAPAPLAGQLVEDIVLEPNAPASLLAVTSTNGGDAGFINLVVETKDNGNTWATLGTPLPSDFIVLTIEIASSDPNRLYVSGVFSSADAPLTIIERSEDRGQTWTRATAPLPNPLAGFFISAVDPNDADVVYGRLASNASDTSGDPPTTLSVSHDKGATWQDLYSTTSSMLGFALSPDGSQIALGGPVDGIFIGPADGSAFQQVSKTQNRCLRWTSDGLYACGKEPFDAFAIGFSTDQGQTYTPIYKRADTCPQTCADSTPYGMLCPTAWPAIAGLILPSAATCTVPWAVVEAGTGTGTAGAGGGTPSSDAGAAADAAGAQPAKGCSCRVGAGGAASRAGVGAGLAFAVTLLARRGKRRKAKQGGTRRPAPRVAHKL